MRLLTSLSGFGVLIWLASPIAGAFLARRRGRPLLLWGLLCFLSPLGMFLLQMAFTMLMRSNSVMWMVWLVWPSPLIPLTYLALTTPAHSPLRSSEMKADQLRSEIFNTRTPSQTTLPKRIAVAAFKLLPLSAFFYWWATRAVPDYIFRAVWFHPSLVILIILANAVVLYLDRNAKILHTTATDIAALAAFVLCPYFLFRLGPIYGNPQFNPGGTYSIDLPTEPNGGYEKVIKRVDFFFRRDKSMLSDPHRYSYVVGEPAKDWCGYMTMPERPVISDSGQCSLWNPFHWTSASCSSFGLTNSDACFTCNGANPADGRSRRIQRLVSLDSQCNQAVIYSSEGLPILDATKTARVQPGEQRQPGPIIKKLPNLREMIVDYTAFSALGKRAAFTPLENRSFGIFLGEAARQGDWATINHLLNAGVNVNVQDDDGSTLLLNAVGHGDIVHQLLEHGANPNLQNIFRQTPLSMAVHNIVVSKDLIAHGANVNQPDANALAQAATTGDPNVIKLLMEHGADTNAKSSGLSPLDQAVSVGNEYTITVLSNGKPSPEKLMLADAVMNRIDKVRAFLDQGVSVNSKLGDGTTALHLAVRWEGRLPLIQLLLDRGAMVNTQNADGQTPLMYARGNPTKKEIVKLLLDHGANVNLRDNQGETALHVYVYSRDLDCVKLILAKKPDLTVRNNQGNTPLMKAVKIGPEMATLLRRAGATQ